MLTRESPKLEIRTTHDPTSPTPSSATFCCSYCRSPLHAASPETVLIDEGTQVEEDNGEEDDSDDGSMRGWPEDIPVPGWPQLARLMADTPNFASFPRFSELNVKSLLYYQAELTELKEELRRLEIKNWRDGIEPLRDYASSAKLLRDSKDTKSARKQWELVVRIRTVLKEYNEALLQFSKTSALKSPERFNMTSLANWLEYESYEAGKGGRPFICSHGSKSWGPLKRKQYTTGQRFFHLLFGQGYLSQRFFPEEKKQKKAEEDLDLVAIHQPEDTDTLTRWVASRWVPFWSSLREKKTEEDNDKTSRAEKGKNSDDSISGVRLEDVDKDKPEYFKKASLETYTHKAELQVTSGIATVLACLLPVLAIAVLSKLHETEDLLGAIAGFTAIFAIGLLFLTDSATTRVEIFTATAAFSAVMVVFVQNQ